MPWSNKARAPQLLSLLSRACEPQLLSLLSRACEPQLLSPHAWSLRTATKSSPPLAETRESPRAAMKTQRSQK